MDTDTGRNTVLVAFLGGIILLIAPVFIETYTLTVLVIYGMLGLSLGLIWGYGGILCFGQTAFFGLGAYSYAISVINIGESSIPILLGLIVPGLFAGLLGAIMFYARLSDVYLGVITLVVTLIFYRFLTATAGPEYVIGAARLGGFNGIPGFQPLNIPGDPSAFIFGDSLYYVVVTALILVYCLMRWLLASPFGRITIAIRDNEQRVALMGYDERARKTILFAISGSIAGLAGAFYACWAEIVTPSLFSLGQSAEIIIWCIVGGLGTLIGPILGGMLFGYVKFLLGQQSSIDNNLILGLILILVVLFLPRGIAPTLALGWKRLFRARHGGASGRRRRRVGSPHKLPHETNQTKESRTRV